MPSICGKRCAAPTSLAFDGTAGSDEVFRALVPARIIEPTSKLDSLRVVEETGVSAPSYAKKRAKSGGVSRRRRPRRSDQNSRFDWRTEPRMYQYIANTSLSPLRPEWRTRREGSRPARQHVRIGVRPLATTAFLP